jgi:hypothetical protein
MRTAAVVMIIVYVRNILNKNGEMGSFLVICDQFVATATARLRVPNWGHANFLYLFFSAHAFEYNIFCVNVNQPITNSQLTGRPTGTRCSYCTRY